MRLTKMKIAGFKSFVDPTTIPFPGNLTGIVGPNGCGKSNVIDAVRWVMGESSAKNLRGESMADVIFNGSSSRKPVGQATIELVFDNSEGKLGGEYAQYNEISIKRTVSRDGTSVYHLNSSRCRRRDITDIFLGTGLGPRSYAIIEQGTISRLIEAKPEDLRIFLEEAAGISKYKERRRETENRIRHTRDNLDRLNDLREELDKQLSHLQRQARTAERYKELKQEERLLKAQFQALRWKSLDGDAKAQEIKIAEQETALEAQTAKQRSAEAETERKREENVEATEAFNEVQSQFYGVGADIARLEQNIQHARERHQHQQQDLAQVEVSWNEAQQHQESDRRKIEELKLALQDTTPAFEQTQQAERASADNLAQAEQAMQEWQAQWEDFNQRAAEPSQTAQVERTRLQQLERQKGQQQQRLSRMEDEKQALSPGNLEQEINELQQRLADVDKTRGELEQQLQGHQGKIGQQREQNNQDSTELDQLRTKLQNSRGRHASLEALQQAALGKQEGAVTQWLEQQGLAEARRLAQGIDVEDGWERAVECVLGANLQAVCVDGMDPVATMLSSLEHGSLTLFDTTVAHASAAPCENTLLLDKLRSDWSVDSLLAGIYAVDGIEQALALRGKLAAHESVITRDGIWLGKGWLRVTRDEDEKAGVLQREHELKDLTTEIALLEGRAEEISERVESGREALHQLESERDTQQQQANDANRQHGEAQAQNSGKQGRLEQLKKRAEGLQAEAEELSRHMAEADTEMEAASKRLHAALAEMEELAKQREALTGQRDALREALDKARGQAHQDRDAAHQHTLRTQTMRTELDTTEQALARMQQQLTQLTTRREELNKVLEEGDSPIKALGDELETLLVKRMEVEQALAAARKRVEDIDHALRELDSIRVVAERQAQEVRGRLEQLRMAWQELKVRRQTLQEQVTESGFDMQVVLQELPEGADVDEWERQAESVSQRIQRLGPINLAAIDEFKQQSERKEYLDAQNADLTEALDTLENAIRKIDRETRTRFRETFDKVNKGLQEKFPRLFGGGHAYLELTGDDLLDTGVTVMARPPGKRNSTIHLLSGGEKALTAVAMVFAIFELNPSPFCMLDEVDAPLDDANVTRFCELVKEMSEHVQFIFITHNKVTMELASHITGVTMHEPGVSRIVAVDVDAAAALAAV